MMMNYKGVKYLRFSIGFDQKALNQNLRIPLYVDFRSVPHLLIVAPSGSGKTYLLVLILRQLSQMKIIVIFADFKGVDFVQLDGCRNYYRHSSVADALERVFNELQKRMANPGQYPPLCFCADEWSGFLGLYSKREQEIFKQQLASILQLGRGVSIFVIIALQRADAAFISGRDNIGNCVGLGRLSSESLSMVFGEYKDAIQPKGRGKGYLRIDGKPLKELTVPRIRDYGKSMELIHSALK